LCREKKFPGRGKRKINARKHDVNDVPSGAGEEASAEGT